MTMKAAKNSLDWLQRLQALWSAIPKPLKAMVGSAAASVVAGYVAWLKAGVDSWTPTQSYLAAVGAASMVMTACGLFLFLRAKARSKVLPLPRLEGLEFYEDRSQLSAQRPLIAELKSAEIIWASWNAGTEAWAKDALDTGRIKKLLLPDPEGQHMKQLAAAVGRSSTDVKADIEGLTRQALAAHVDIRWSAMLPGNTLIIGDPEANTAWTQVETLFSGTGAYKRPSFRIARARFPTAFQNIKESYQRNWESAVIPPAAHVNSEQPQDALSVSAKIDPPALTPKLPPNSAQPPSSPGTLSEDLVLLEWEVSGGLHFRASTREPEPKEGVEVSIESLLRWHSETRQWAPVREFDKAVRPIRLLRTGGESKLYMDAPQTFAFLREKARAGWLVKYRAQGSMLNMVLPCAAWRADVRVEWSKKTRIDRFHFEVLADKSPRPIEDPSMGLFKIFSSPS